MRALGTAACLVLVLASCTSGGGDGSAVGPDRRSSSTQRTNGWSEPGLVDRRGRPVEVVGPARGTGRDLDVTDFGADPAAGSGDDAVAIRAAVEAAEVGDTIVLPDGTFDLDSSDPSEESAHVVLRSGVHLRGAGADRTVLVSSFDGEPDSTVVLGEAVDGLTISDLAVSSTFDGPLGTDPDDEGGGGPMFGIRLVGRGDRASASILVRDIRVERFQRHGISLKATRRVVVRGCQVADATSVGPGGNGYGIAVEGRADQRDPAASTDSRHNVVVGNILDGTHLRHAVLLQFPTHNNLVADNLVTGGVLDAIDVHGEGEYLNEIRGNTVVGGGRAAIALGNSGGATHDHGAAGEGNWVHHNDLVGNRDGIVVILGTPESLIEANRIVPTDDSEVGIVVDDGPGTVVRDNLVRRRSGFVPFRLDDEVERSGNRGG